jgi:hypothetical protein
MMEGSGAIQIIPDPDPGGPKTYGSGSTALLNRFDTELIVFFAWFLHYIFYNSHKIESITVKYR